MTFDLHDARQWTILALNQTQGRIDSESRCDEGDCLVREIEALPNPVD